MQEDVRTDSDSRPRCLAAQLLSHLSRLFTALGGIVKALCASSSLDRGRSHGLGPRDAPLEHVL
jgi:hypothetical protein